MSELYTKIFVKAAVSHSQLLALVASVGGGRVSDWTIVAGGHELDVRPNEDASSGHDAGHDGFLFWPFTVEVAAPAAGDATAYVQFVGRVMTGLHRAGMSVVAACDWEDQLPGGGSLLVPQPVGGG